MSTNQTSFNYGLPNRHPKLPKKISKKAKSTISKFSSENVEFRNPEPVPYQRAVFQPCTISKVIDIPKRFVNGFLDTDMKENQPQRGIILHTDRYVWNNMKDVIRFGNQSDRLIAEENYLKKVQFLKKMSGNRLKAQNQNLVLEGENLFSSQQADKLDLLNILYHRGKHNLHLNEKHSGMIPPAPTVIENFPLHEKEIDQPEILHLGFAAIQKIKLQNRTAGSDNVSSAPLQSNQRTRGSLDNVFQNTKQDKLPPIINKSFDFDFQGRKSEMSINSQTDYESVFRQSERQNKPNGRINEYIMDGTQVRFNERADIQGELRFLKSIILPSVARELYVGRGIHLPSNHATKIPRGKYFDSNKYEKPKRRSDLTIPIAGGGSVTINTNTPIEENVMINRDEHENQMEDMVIEKEKTEETKRPSNSIFEIIEEINRTVSKNNDGLMKAEAVNNIFQRDPSLSQEWKMFISTIFQSVDAINMDQLMLIAETEILSHPFQSNLPQFQIEEAKQIMPFLFNLFQSENSLRLQDLLPLLDPSNVSIISLQQLEELYDRFIQLISQEENVNFESIQKSHSLLFIPYVLMNLKQ